ncbi:MAG: nicotinate-nucleotide--dimethylbenzimidazole phosphoribosyltransferase [Chloroflexi bacterium]|nr:nicotinate-nucleotide--dimethylbenzimidazole phosphoribosyltransferase [Chloroflexota bacterium]
MNLLTSTIARIGQPDAEAAAAARRRQALLTKPAGSLGTLERLHVTLAAIQGCALPAVEQPAVLVVAADHGVATAGVSAYPRQVTAEMVRNFARGGAAINVLAQDARARLVVADLGIDWQGAEPPAGILRRPIAPGTANLAERPAMSRAEAVRAVEVGITLAQELIADGADLIALGEMGIANTTASAALIAALAGRPPRDVTGLGTGVDHPGWQRKVAVIERALARAQVDASDPLGALAELGGFEIGALAGAMLGAAAAKAPVLLDGLIVGAAALLAVTLVPSVQPYLIASHRSVEPGHRVVLELLELEPLMDLGLRLGEGSGAAVALHLIRAACALPRQMATFAEAGVSTQSEAGVSTQSEAVVGDAPRMSNAQQRTGG